MFAATAAAAAAATATATATARAPTTTTKATMAGESDDGSHKHYKDHHDHNAA